MPPNSEVIHAVTEQRLNTIEKMLTDLLHGQKEQNGRVRKLELWRSFLAGVASLAIVVGVADLFLDNF